MSGSTSQRIAKNTVFLYVRMLFVMLINIFSVRFVLKGLGVVDYGIFDVVAGLVTMFSSLSSIISTASLRFHSYAIGEGKKEETSNIFSASLNIFAILAIAVLVIGEVIGIWFFNTQADIPEDRIFAANWVFQFTIASFVIGLLISPFSALIFAYERMSLFSIISIAECVLKFFLAYSLVHLSGDHLLIYGLGLLLIQIGLFGTYYITSMHGESKCHYNRRVDKALYKRILSFSGWTLFSSSASVGISQLVTMITNVFFGPVVNAARAIAFQVNSAMNSFTGNVIMALKPPMIKQYAEGDYEKVNRYFFFCNKAVYYSLLLILLPVFFEMETVLYYWLDVDDQQTVLFCRLILVYSLILSLNNPISIIVQATGNIRAYSTYVEIPTLLCFPLTWFLYANGLPAETAFYVMILSIIASHIIRLICLKRLFAPFSFFKYIIEFIVPAIVITFFTSLVLMAIRHFISPSLLRLLITLMTGSVVLTISSCYGALTKLEREALFSLIKMNKRG